MSAIRIMMTAALFLTAARSDAAEKDNKLPDKAKAVLEKADSWELFSLDPRFEADRPKDGGFHGWKVLGKTEVKDAKTREQLLASLTKGIADSDGNGAKCFDPRHGIRAKFDNQSVDVVICFECSWVYVFYNGGNNREGTAVTTRTPQDAFDKVLKDAKVPLPKPADK
jgi:hypothetical protein